MKFINRMLQRVKLHYGSQKTIDPESRSYTALKHLLDSLSTETLEKLQKEQLVYISHLAANRIRWRNGHK